MEHTPAETVTKYYASTITGRVHSVRAPAEWDTLGDTPLRATEAEAMADLPQGDDDDNNPAYVRGWDAAEAFDIEHATTAPVVDAAPEGEADPASWLAGYAAFLRGAL